MAERKIVLLTEYDGSCFHGWQYQNNAFSVQQAIADTWRKLTGEQLKLTGSSRTDAGVHALGHVSHFRTNCSIPTDRIPLALNSLLPAGVSIKQAIEAAPSFHARFDAIGKTYYYRIFSGRIRPALQRGFSAHVPGNLDLSAMREASRHLLGERDFRALMDQGTAVRTTVRELIRLELAETERQMIRLEISGSGFLYHMVRIIAGTLVQIGQGKIAADDLPSLLAAGDRTCLGQTMPPQGLFLQRVFYPDSVFGDDSRADYDKLRTAEADSGTAQ